MLLFFGSIDVLDITQSQFVPSFVRLLNYTSSVKPVLEKVFQSKQLDITFFVAELINGVLS